MCKQAVTTTSCERPDYYSLEAFRVAHEKWLKARTKLLTADGLTDDEVCALSDEVEELSKSLLTRFVKDPSDEWVRAKFEVARSLLNGDPANWADNRLYLILGQLEADLIAAVDRLAEHARI